MSLNTVVQRDAMVNPEYHEDLLVRVVGLNDRFMDLSKLEHDEILTRVEAITG